MLMTMRNRNRANGEATHCARCCDWMLSKPANVKRERRSARRRERQALAKDMRNW